MLIDWERTGEIVKQTLGLARKDRSLYLPVVLNAVLCIILLCLGIIAVVTLGNLGWVIAAVCFFLIFFVDAICDAALSWMVLEVIKGKDVTLHSGLSRAKKKFGSLLIYAAVSLVISLFVRELRKNRDIATGLLGSIFGVALKEGWDIAGHFMLPAIVLTNHDFRTAAKELPVLLKHIPEALVGGFAFDFVVGWLYMIEFVICVLFFFMFAGVSMWFAFSFSLLLFLVLVVGTYIFYSFTKSVYFTVMYVELHPELKT